jgi:uncharacterized OB-fold protein
MLIGGKCNNCDYKFFPFRRTCPRCGSHLISEEKLPRKGRVLDYTVVHNPPRGYEYYTPYVIALVELENGAKVLTQLTDVDPEEVKEGMEVEMSLRILRVCGESGFIAYGYKFRPVVK